MELIAGQVMKRRWINAFVGDQATVLVKAKIQEFRARRDAFRYFCKARLLGVHPLSEAGLTAALRARLGSRCKQHGWPKQKGSLHIFLCYTFNNWEARLPEALGVFGKVSQFEWRSAGYDDRKMDWVSHRDSMNRAMLDAFHAANAERPVDVVIGFLSGYTAAPETIAEITQLGAVVLNCCFDDKLGFPGLRIEGRYSSTAGIAHAVDLNLTSAPESLVKYAVHGGLALFAPEAADPEVHRPYDVPYKYDISFVGGNYGKRGILIRKLAELGIKVECFGAGWPNGPVSDEEMVKIYSRSRINLGFAGIGYSDRLMCLKGRDFEVPMSGGLYLTQHNPELELVYEIGKEIVTYRDVKDCASKIQELLRQPEHAEAIRQAGRARCLRDHTYEARWTKVLTLVGILEG